MLGVRGSLSELCWKLGMDGWEFILGVRDGFFGVMLEVMDNLLGVMLGLRASLFGVVLGLRAVLLGDVGN